MTPTRRNFRTLLIVTWMLATAAYVVQPFDWNSMPAGVRDAAYAAYYGGMPFSVNLHYFLSYLFFFLFVVSTVGLFAFKKWARRLYVFYYVAGLALGLIPSFTVYGRPYYLIAWLFSLSSTSILSLIFFSPMKDQFSGARADEFR